MDGKIYNYCFQKVLKLLYLESQIGGTLQWIGLFFFFYFFSLYLFIYFHYIVNSLYRSVSFSYWRLSGFLETQRKVWVRRVKCWPLSMCCVLMFVSCAAVILYFRAGNNVGCGRKSLHVLYVIPVYCVGASLMWVCGNYVEHTVFVP